MNKENTKVECFDCIHRQVCKYSDDFIESKCAYITDIDHSINKFTCQFYKKRDPKDDKKGE